MDLTVGTFNLNNLFGRWNLYVDAPQPSPAGATAASVPQRAAATKPPRDWLEPAPASARATGTARAGTRARPKLPDVKIVIEGNITPDGIKWRTNPYDGRVVYKKTPQAQKTLADRIRAIDVDVLAVQEVESIEALKEFVDAQKLDDAGYKHLVLVEGNDERLIDVGVISRQPIGAVLSWRHRTYENKRAKPIFSRDLLQVEILSNDRKQTLLMLYVNHLKSKLARDADETRAGNLRRKRQAETIAAILTERPPPGPFIVLGDMNDTPTTPRLAAIRDLGLIDALSDPEETGGPYPANDPTPPPNKVWTHRFRAKGKTDYELFDQIWLSPDLAPKQTGAWINRRNTREGDATDHDPPYIRLSL
jgi:endonuclease/exonuclease/phosphatase family metal-dependent hydrolase